MKKVFSIILLFIALFALSSCKDENDVTVLIKNGDKVVEIIVDDKDITEGMTMEQLLLSDEYKDKFKADMVDGAYGKYINGIYEITPDPSKGEYISVYTTLFDYTFGEAVVVNEIEFKAASVGVSELMIVAGAAYMFSLEAWVAE